MTYSKTLAMCAALAATAGGFTAMTAPASAKDRPVVVVAQTDIVTRRVAYADLNLATSGGEKALNQRVGLAVRSVCKEVMGNASDFHGAIACRDFAWDEARPQMKRAMQRAHDLAATGSSSYAAVAITLAAPR